VVGGVQIVGAFGGAGLRVRMKLGRRLKSVLGHEPISDQLAQSHRMLCITSVT
jgi:hypothetical protein